MKKNIYLIALSLAGLVIIALTVFFLLRKKETVKVDPVETSAARGKQAQAAIVIDDLGYNEANLEKIFRTGTQLTLSILPHQAFSASVSAQAVKKGYECILHMPMEPLDDKVSLEPRTILADMPEKEILFCLEEAFKSVPDAAGVSNHMGSKITVDERVMKVILSEVKARKIYFMDSRTTADSVCGYLCRRMKVFFVQRDIFLDGESDRDYIRAQFKKLEKKALSKGKAVGVIHDRTLSIEVMVQMIPEMQKAGIEFVPLSKLLEVK